MAYAMVVTIVAEVDLQQSLSDCTWIGIGKMVFGSRLNL